MSEIDYSGLPEHLRGGMQRYIEHGIPPGGFLTAVLENDLAGAFGRADNTSLAALHDIVRWAHWVMPAGAWGSPAKVQAWITAHWEVDLEAVGLR